MEHSLGTQSCTEPVPPAGARRPAQSFRRLFFAGRASPSSPSPPPRSGVADDGLAAATPWSSDATELEPTWLRIKLFLPHL